MNLIAHHLQFTVQAETYLHLGPQAGAQLRGALWAALQQFACAAPNLRHNLEHQQTCPMCRLVAYETAESARGLNPPRPFAIQPPLSDNPGTDRFYNPGGTFTFSISLYGDAADLFPYLCQAVYRMGSAGIGYGRGRFSLVDLQAVNPVSGAWQTLLEDKRIIATPDVPVTGAQIQQAVASSPADRLHLQFLTPTQITMGKRALARQPTFAALIARLLERCQAIEETYTDQPTPQPVWRERYLDLTERARTVRSNHSTIRWINVRSGSRRANRIQDIGGFCGDVTYEGDLHPFHEWLLWGQSLHVGKNAVKGAGWYRLDP
jgi:hypothetical protein